MLIPAELLVEFTDDVYNQNCKNRKISPELFEKINKSIDNIKSKTKNKYSIIANDERLFKDNPNLKYISELSCNSRGKGVFLQKSKKKWLEITINYRR